MGNDNTVNFNQPSSDSATLNRVTGDFTSEIAGQINANGSVFLINPNGIMITKDGVIDTGNFVVSTLDIDTNDFLNGDYTFTKNGSNGVVANHGRISVDDGGFVALLGGAVKNEGTIRAHVGKVGFASGEKIVMSFGNNDFLRVEVPTDKWDTLTDSQGNKVSATVDLGGTVDSRGGFIDITVADASDILRQTISINGIVSANTVSSTNGVISISGGTLGVYGKITADADYGNAGSINVAVDSIDGKGQFSAVSQNGTGGKIKISLQHGADLTAGTSFDVSGRTAGGSLSLIGGLSGKGGSKILGSIDFKADSTNGKGGYIDIGNKGGLVGLLSGAISATGKAQGGRIRIGGAFQGGGYDPKTSQLDTKTQDLFVTRWSDNSTLVSASKTSLGTGVHIDVSSASGTGGTAILWADHTTNNYAAIDATGATGGGAVEISAKKKVESFGLARVKAGNGVILLDPKNVSITAKWGSAANQVQKIASRQGSGESSSQGDEFGASVALSRDGSRLAIGAPGVANGGAVYIYDVTGGKWGATATYKDKIKDGILYYSIDSKKIVKLALESSERFGSSVALSADGSKLAVGAPYYGKAGSVRLFRLNTYHVEYSNGKRSTDVEGLFNMIGGNNRFGIPDDARFGASVAMSGDGLKIAVGAYDDFESKSGVWYSKTCGNGGRCRGAVYVYSMKSWSLDDITNRKFAKINRQHAGSMQYNSPIHGDRQLSRLYDYHRFGFSVAMSSNGKKLAVGDPIHRHMPRTANNNHQKGAVHLIGIGYPNNGGVSPYYARLVTSSDSGIGDNFGASVALSSDGFKLAVGAPNHDNGAAGENKYGAVYLYEIPDNGWARNTSRDYGNFAPPTLMKKIDVEHAGFELGASDGLRFKHLFGTSVAFDKTGDKLVIGSPGASNETGHVRLINLSDMRQGIQQQLNSGANLTYYASNNITVDADITASGGKLTLIAGKSIIVNQNINIKGGLVLKANDASAANVGYDPSIRDTGKAVITVAAGKKLETEGDLIIKMLAGESGAANNKKQTGKITVDKVKGKRVSIAYAGATGANSDSEIVIRNGGQVEATKSPSSAEVVLELKADKFTNLSNSNALKTASKGLYLVWAKTPATNTMGGITNYGFVQFNKPYSGSGWSNAGLAERDKSAFIYSANPSLTLSSNTNKKTKVYDGNSAQAGGATNTFAFKNNGVYNGLKFKIGGYVDTSSNKHFNFKGTFTTNASGKFYNTAGTAEQKDVGTNLTLKFAGHAISYVDGNNVPAYGLASAPTIDNVTGASITQRILQLKVNDLAVRDRLETGGNKIAPVYIKGGLSGYSGAVVSNETVTLTINDGAFVYDNDRRGDDKPIYIGDTSKFTLSSGNYKLQYGASLVGGTLIDGLTGNIKVSTRSGGGNTDQSPDGNGGGGGGGGGGDSGAGVVLLGAGAVVATQTGVLAKVTAAATAAAGAAGAAGGAGAAGAAGAGAAGGAGGASGTLGVPLGSIDTIFNSGVYAHLSGIDMQALYQPQTPIPSIFNTPQQVTYKAKYTTTYDMTMLAHNIKAQKAVPLYELDEHLYETLRRIFVQQSIATDKTAYTETNDNDPV